MSQQMNQQTNQQMITFRLGAELFAASITTVERVLRYAPPRVIANMPSWMTGVLEYQQRPLPVVDLRQRFSVNAAPLNRQSRLLVFRLMDDHVIGIVDGVLEIATLDPVAVLPAPVVRGMPSEYLTGIVRRKDALVALVDMERVFSPTERATFSAFATPAPAPASA